MNSQAMYLPSEILFRVFKEISREQQPVLQIVCKSWYYPARQICFSSLHLKDKCDVSKLIYSLQSAGQLVKSLKLDKHTKLNQHDMIRLIRACPQLGELCIYNLASYFEWLFTEHVPLPRLKRLALMGRVSWRSNETNACYYRVAHQYRDQLENLEIILACSPVFGQEFGGIMNYLASFGNLRDLFILSGSRNVCVYFDQLLNHCRGLERLKIDLGHPLVDPNNTNHLSFQLYPTMRSIDIFLTKFSLPYFRYMMHRFVNLSEMHVRMNQSRMDWIADKKDIVSFMKREYIPFIKQLSHSSLVIKMQDASCIADAMAEFTCNDAASTVDASFEIHDGRHQRTEISLDKKRNNSTIAHYLFMRDFSSSESTELPFLKHLVTYGSQIKKLAINMSSLMSRSIDLGLILKECGSVKELQLDLARMWELYCSWDDQMKVFQSRSNLTVTTINDNVINDHLVRLQLSRAMITPGLINKMSRHIPNLRYLNLFNCTFFMEDGNTTEFDMSNLDLKMLVMDVKSFYHLPHTCFKISSAGGGNEKGEYYLLDAALNSFEKVTSTDRVVNIELRVHSIETLQVHVGKYSRKQQIQEYIF
ncbi:hypothetical protein INT47_004027 [Mucor saturninus]|uniref:F-box domain-containing protein n=1 Tax=Mucor saturninus TaxID=64648 RepID=A0A8H7R741_9FUNG|nr:hypothetical protein INT47_004027 [Mucor saturninus]